MFFCRASSTKDARRSPENWANTISPAKAWTGISSTSSASTTNALKKEIAKDGGDWEMLNWIQANAKHQRQPWEIAAWSEYHVRRTPDSDIETLEFITEQLKKLSTLREDIHTWFDLLDLDDHCTFGGKA